MEGTERTRQESGELQQRLRLRHLIMLSVGGTVASGFFLFIGAAIGIAGPAVVFTIAAVGLVTMAVMACLAELSVTRAVAGAFSVYARETMGPLVGFLTGWNYWLAWVMGAAAESLAAGTYLHAIRPEFPIWAVAGVIVAVIMTINLVGVYFMGETEFWLSTLKLTALGIFVVLGIAAILGIGFSARGIDAYTAYGGFAPNGVGAVFAALFTVFFAYVGIEMMSASGEESVHPERDIPRGLIWTAAIISLLFISGSLVLMALVPWERAATTSRSPFVDALNTLHVPVIVAVFSWVIIIASLSSVNGGLYTASRMMFSLSREGYFPKALRLVHDTRGVPTPAIVVTSLCIFVGAVIAFISPNFAYVFVASLSAFGFLFAWLVIPIVQMLYRRQRGEDYVRALQWRVPLYPLTPLVAIGAVLIAFVGQFFFGSGTTIGPVTIPGNGVTVVVGLVWTGLWTLYYLTMGRTMKDRLVRENRGETREVRDASSI
jgi:amino acid transporter, AAT family